MPVKLSSYQGLFGKPVVLYFYPADGTPGCTKQAQALKESFAEFKQVPDAPPGIQPTHNKYTHITIRFIQHALHLPVMRDISLPLQHLCEFAH